MATGADLVTLASQHLGQAYVLGVIVPKDDPNWRGPWDCSEFASWCVFQVTRRLYGCLNDASNPGDRTGAHAFTGYWSRDVESLGTKISVEEARVTPGAAVLRLPHKNAHGHVVFSDGSGGTIEAHGAATGVIQAQLGGRPWHCGIKIPNIEYTTTGTPRPVLQPGRVYRLTSPLMEDETVAAIQRALNANGFDPGPQDSKFGWRTTAAVIEFQKTKGLVVDGEVGPETAAALRVTLA